MVALPRQMLPATPSADVLTVTLPRDADTCHELFCDLERIPEWLTVVRSVVIQERDRLGRPRRVAFMARLRRATVGYSCVYRYSGMRVHWATSSRSSIKIAGHASFAPLGPRSCMMSYALDMSLGETGLPEFDDDVYSAHAASATLNDFREFVTRVTTL
jgi:hypothetical protein